MLYLLYSLTGDADAASQYEVAHDRLPEPLSLAYYQVDNATPNITYNELLYRCTVGLGLDPADEPVETGTSLWGTAEYPCLPAGVKERPAEVFTNFAQHLKGRLYYQNNVLPIALGAACPFVFIFDETSGQWLFDTAILYKLDSVEKGSLQARPLQRFTGSILIQEIERERSLIDQLYIELVHTDGSITTLAPQNSRLTADDGVELILDQGDHIEVEFPTWRMVTKDDIAEVRIVAQCYYLPYRQENTP